MSRHFDVIATFDDSAKAEAAFERLLARGIATHDITVLVGDRAHGRHLTVAARHKFPHGAALGGLLGGGFGAAAAVAAACTIPSTPDLAEPWTASALVLFGFAGAGAGGLLGWLLGGLAGLGFDRHEARLVDGEEDGRAAGHVVVGVRAESVVEAEVAELVFEREGATSVAS